MNIVDTIKLNELESVANANKYRLVKLLDSAGRIIVHQNQPTTAAFKSKLQEIKTRVNVLPSDSVYMIVFKNTPRGEEWAYKFTKGNPVTIMQQTQPLAQSAATFNYDAIAAKDAEISALKNQIEQLKLQFMYESKLSEMNAKIQELSERKEEKSQLVGFAETVLPTFMPVLQEYMSIRKMEAQAKLNAGGQPNVQRKPKLPEKRTAQYEQMIDNLCAMEETQFNEQIAQLANIDQNYAAQVYNDCTEEETTTEEPKDNE